MEELLRVIAEVDEEEDVLVKVLQAEWSSPSLKLIVEASTDSGDMLGRWVVRCEHLLGHELKVDVGFSLELLEEHPLLWAFTSPNASAFFTGNPTNVDACVGALYEAHEAAVGSWLPFGAALNRISPISILLKTGHGLLAEGPVPLLMVYKEALFFHGVEISIVGEYDLRFYDGGNHKATRGERVKVLLIGNSYALGIGWTAQRIENSSKPVSVSS